MDASPTPPVEKIRVLIVDDHAVVRQGLRTFLELHSESPLLPIEVVGEADNGVKAVELALKYQPDIVLLDLVMPEMDGIAATPRIIQNCPQTQVIILTSFGEKDKVIPAIRAGAQSYLLKDIPPNDLVHAIRQAYLGKVQLHPEAARSLMTAIAEDEPVPPAPASSPTPSELTERELEVLLLIAEGFSNRKIAKKLFISEKTVKSHVSNILSKLHLEDRTQAAIYALKNNLNSSRT